MAEAAPDEDFEIWLSLKLKELNTDESVFGSYIKGILEGEETVEEKTEALEDIMSQIIETDIPLHCREILDHWKACQIILASKAVMVPAVLENVEEKLAKLLESNIRPSAVQRQYTEEERKIREAILAQYSQTSDVDSGDEDDGGGNSLPSGKENGLVKNTNASLVHQAEREKREQAKIDSQKKKEKDKEDREKQKQQQQEKKEKRKTQKGERRR